MAITYSFTQLGFSKVITVYKDGSKIYTNASLSAPKDAMVNEAKLALKDNYPGQGIETMQKEDPPNPTSPSTTTQAPPSQANSASTTVTVGSNQPPAKVEQKEIKPPEGKSLAQGFGKITSSISKIINKIRVKINDFYYGKTGISTKQKLANPLDYGLINILNLLASIDLCAIFSFAANKLGNQFGTKKFNPKDKDSQTKTTLGKIKFEIQYAAYQIQTIIDGYYTSYGDLRTIESKTALGQIVTNLSNYLEILNSPAGNNPFQNPELRTAFPMISIFDNYLQNASKFLSLNQNIEGLKSEQIDKILSYIDKTRQVCISIQALNNPANLLAFADTFLNAGVAEALKKLDKLIDPKKIIPVIKKIVEVCKKIQSACNQILGFINMARTIIQIATILIKIFKIIVQFLLVLPMPNLFTTTGVTTTIASAENKLTRFADNLLKRLSEINSILSNIYYLVQDISIKIGNITDIIDLIKLNLESCDPGLVDPIIISDLSSISASLKETKKQFDDFVKTYDANKQKADTTFGGYTIVILKEEVVDEGISLRRRYGVALDKSQAKIVQSTPTFASDDQIIIQEVKLLLRSKNLVPETKLSITPEEASILEESLNFLEEPSIDINEEPQFEDGMDDPENEDTEDDSLGLNAFISGLKRGKRLRRRMRRKMAEAKIKLAQELAKSDKGGKYTSKLVKKQRIGAIEEAIKAEIELIRIKHDDINKFSILLSSLALAPFAIAKIRSLRREIRSIQKNIKELKKQLVQVKAR